MEVGTVLLCIFNDRPMPGARESGKILFVTCWRCAGAPAPQLISGKMRMLAGWPVGLVGRGSQSWGLQDPQSHQVGPNQGAWHRATATVLKARVGVWAVGTPCPSPANATPFPSSPALGAAYCSAAPAPQVGTAHGVFCWSITLCSRDGCYLSPTIYLHAVLIPWLLYPILWSCHPPGDAAVLCGRLRFIHSFISTRL